MNNGLRVSLVALSMAFASARADDVVLTASPLDVPVAPGSSAPIVFTVTNNSDTDFPPLFLKNYLPASYSYALVGSVGCGPLTQDSQYVGVVLSTVAVAPVSALTQRTCTVNVIRSLDGIDSEQPLWQLSTAPDLAGHPYAFVQLRVGTFVDTSLQADKVAVDIGDSGVHSVFKLTLHNSGPKAVAPKVSILWCGADFSVDAHLPGACPVEPGSCGEQHNFDPALVHFPTLAANATSECLVGITSATADHQPPLAFVGPLADPSSGGLVFESNRVNSEASLAVPAVSLNQAGLSGAWANSLTPGQGIVMDVQTNAYGDGHALLFAGWFTYDLLGSGEPRWYTLQGDVHGMESTFPVYLTRNGRFDSAQPTETTPAGSATLSFNDCAHAKLDYTIAETATSSARSAAIPLTRLLSDPGCTPAGTFDVPPASYAMSGIWADGSNAGQGLVVTVDTARNILFAAWYTYTAQANVAGVGGQRWYTLQAAFTPGATEATAIAVYESAGGSFDGEHDIAMLAVGTAHFALHSCTSATLDYTFTSGANAGISGSLALGRLGATAPGCAL